MKETKMRPDMTDDLASRKAFLDQISDETGQVNTPAPACSSSARMTPRRGASPSRAGPPPSPGRTRMTGRITSPA